MPTYSSKCEICGTAHEYIRKVDLRNDTPTCCGQATVRTLDTPMVSAMAFTGHKGFFLPTADNGGKGTWIEDGAQYNKYVREHNLIVGNEGKQEADRNKARIEKETAANRRKTVEEVVNRAMT